MKYDVTFSCGHTEEVQIYGKTEERERKIKYYGKSGLCSECYKKKMNEENAENCEEVVMSYREYKENYSDCKTKSGSYDKAEKTIVVYVPKQEEKEEDARETFGKAMDAALEELKKENKNAAPEDVMPAMIARQLDKMGYTEENLKKMEVPETILKDVLERKEVWTK